jgi:hypothetical protein
MKRYRVYLVEENSGTGVVEKNGEQIMDFPVSTRGSIDIEADSPTEAKQKVGAMMIEDGVKAEDVFIYGVKLIKK